jgi:hypothetical protein
MNTVTGEEIPHVETHSGRGTSVRVGGGFLYAVAALCVVVGLITVFGGVRAVGGDAYNYMIGGIYGLVFVTVGLVFAVMGSAAMIVGAVKDLSR